MKNEDIDVVFDYLVAEMAVICVILVGACFTVYYKWHLNLKRIDKD